VSQRAAGLVLALGGDDLGPGLPSRFGFCCHGPLQLLRHPDVLDLHPLYLATVAEPCFNLIFSYLVHQLRLFTTYTATALRVSFLFLRRNATINHQLT
jgi:hypothetical protein